MEIMGILPRLRLLLLPLAALFALANAGAIGTPQRYTLDASASNVSAKVPFFGLASKTARFPRSPSSPARPNAR